MCVSCSNQVQHFVTPWAVAHQAHLFMRFSRQEYWSELPFPSSGDLPNPGIKPGSPALQVDSLPPEPPVFHSSCTNLQSYPQYTGEGSGTPLQYSCLENPMDGGAGKAAVHVITEGWTRLSDFTFTFPFYALEKEMATHSSVLAWRIPGTGQTGGLLSLGSHGIRHN